MRRAFFQTWSVAYRFLWDARVAAGWDYVNVSMKTVPGGFKVEYP